MCTCNTQNLSVVRWLGVLCREENVVQQVARFDEEQVHKSLLLVQLGDAEEICKTQKEDLVKQKQDAECAISDQVRIQTLSHVANGIW